MYLGIFQISSIQSKLTKTNIARLFTRHYGDRILILAIIIISTAAFFYMSSGTQHMPKT